MKDVLTKEVEKSIGAKTRMVLQKDSIALIEIDATKEVGFVWYQVWNFYENLVFIRTKDLKEALDCYVKYNCKE